MVQTWLHSSVCSGSVLDEFGTTVAEIVLQYVDCSGDGLDVERRVDDLRTAGPAFGQGSAVG